MLIKATPTNKVIPLIITPQMRLREKYNFWVGVEYFTMGFSVALLLLILASENWARLGFPVFTLIIAFMAGYFKKHIFEAAGDGYKLREKEGDHVI